MFLRTREHSSYFTKSFGSAICVSRDYLGCCGHRLPSVHLSSTVCKHQPAYWLAASTSLHLKKTSTTQEKPRSTFEQTEMLQMILLWISNPGLFSGMCPILNGASLLWNMMLNKPRHIKCQSYRQTTSTVMTFFILLKWTDSGFIIFYFSLLCIIINWNTFASHKPPEDLGATLCLFLQLNH